MELRRHSLLALLGPCLISAAGFGQNTFPSSGNVGIGTTSPGTALEVKGTSSTDVTYIGDGTNKMAFYPSGAGMQMGSYNNIPLQFFTNNAGAQMTLLTNGNLGIGVTTPGERLEIGNSGNLRITGDNFGINVDSGGAWGYNNWLYRTLWNSTYGDLAYFAPSGNHPATNDAAMILNGNVLFGSGKSTGDGLTTEWMRISGGNVGIGTTNPQAKMEINGNLRFTADGSVQTTAWTGVLCGGDYAEAVETTELKAKYEPGDVLVISAESEGKVQKSSEPYATNVSGIYATKPGVVGKRDSIAKVSDDIPMAMVGIVPTKVSAENGAIHPGDLLVSSSHVGYAMKGTDRNKMLGAVIGKAMGTLENGTGAIEVLVTLQ